MKKYAFLDEYYDKILELRHSGCTYSSIITKLNLVEKINGKTLRRKGSVFSGIMVRRFPHLYKGINEGFITDIFKNIDSEEKAYWIGFFTADGYLIKNRNEIGLEISIKDLNHLIKFKRFIDIDYVIKYRTRYRKGNYNNTCFLRFSSRTLKKQFNDLNIKANKTYSGEFTHLYKIPTKFHRHFWRGYIDGDGNISNHSLQICFNYDTHLFFLHFLRKYKLNKFYKTRNLFNVNNSIRFPQQISKIILDILYENSNIYLERKYIDYQNMNIKFQKYYIHNAAIMRYPDNQLNKNNIKLTFNNFKQLVL